MKRGRESVPQTLTISAAAVSQAKQKLWSQLVDGCTGGGDSYLSRAESELRSRLNIAFTQRVSTSLLVVGPVGSGKKRLVESLLATYNVGKGKCGIAVARIKGLVCTTDQQALCSIADQFLLRSGVGFEKNVTVVLRDLEAHFRQCMIDGHPAVVLLEDIHIFAARDKQVLIYTLLDFMHKQECLFVVVGLTPCAHLNSLLEKRVLSRLNAQFVYVPPVTGDDVIAEFRRRLRLCSANPTPSTNADDGGMAIVKEGEEAEALAAYFKRFDVGVDAMFAEPSSAGAGLCFALRRYCEWGKGISHFLRAAQLAVALLTPEEPWLTAAGLEAALYSQDPPSLAERLAGLPGLELRLFAAVVRLHGRKMGEGAVAAEAAAVQMDSAGEGGAAGLSAAVGGGGALPLASSSSSGRGKASKKGGDRSITIEEALREFELLTTALRTKETTSARLVQGLQALAAAGLVLLTNASAGGAHPKPAPASLLSDRTLVVMLPPEHEARAAFSERGGGADGGRARVGRPVPTIIVSDRIRSAVLEPLRPVPLG